MFVGRTQLYETEHHGREGVRGGNSRPNKDSSWFSVYTKDHMIVIVFVYVIVIALAYVEHKTLSYVRVGALRVV